MGSFALGMLVEQVTNTATAAGITTFSATSTQIQVFTGSTTQTVKLPPTTSMLVGQFFEVYNSSTGALTIQYQDGTSFTLGATIAAGASLIVKLTSVATTNGTWVIQSSSSGGGGVTSVAMAVPTFLSVSGSPITTAGTLTVTLSGTALPVANGGTGATSVTIAPTATAFAGWDVNSNLSANNFIGGYTSNVTSSGTTTLTVSSAIQQYFTGTLSQTVKLPVTGTLVLGQSFIITNLSTGTITVESSGGNTILSGMPQNTQIICTVILTTGTTAASWSFVSNIINLASEVTGILPGANGGTGQGSAWNSGGVIYASNTSTQASTAVGTSGFTLQSQGSGSAPHFAQFVGIANGGTGAGTAAAAFTALSPLTTLGDTLAYSTTNIRQAVPADYGSLIPDSNQTTGWRSSTYLRDLQGRPGKNYIQYADFENNSTTGWTLGTIGTLTNGLPTGSPTFGSGASGNLSIASTATSIEGAFSLNYVSSAATTQGNMVASSSYAIDVEDQAKVLTVKFYYTAASGTANCNFSGTSSNSYAWAVYDVTNSVWLTSAGNFNLIQGTGCGYVTGTVQTGATTANIRLCVYNANATAGATTLTLDGFYVGPQTAPSGPAMTDWVAYTPSISAGFGTCTNVAFYWKREGDTLRVQGSFTSGTIAASLGSFSLPSGLNIDSTKITLSTTTSSASPSFGLIQANAASNVGALVACLSTSTSVIYFANDLSGANSLTPTNVSGALTSNALYTLSFAVPITGWSSNSSQSSDTDTRVCVMQANGTPGSTAGAAITIFPTAVFDTHGGYNTSTGQYKIPVTGYYGITGYYPISNVGLRVLAYINGVSNITIGQNLGTSDTECNLSGLLKCNAGDLVDIRPSSTTGAFNTTGNWSLQRVTGPAVITATESVNARYYASSTAISGSLATIVWSTKDYDSHNAMSSGLYATPVSGKYQINCALLITGTISLNTTLIMEIQKNSTVVSRDTEYLPASLTDGKVLITDTISCLANDIIRIQVSTSATLPTIVSSNFDNYFSISRVGN